MARTIDAKRLPLEREFDFHYNISRRARCKQQYSLYTSLLRIAVRQRAGNSDDRIIEKRSFPMVQQTTNIDSPSQGGEKTKISSSSWDLHDFPWNSFTKSHRSTLHSPSVMQLAPAGFQLVSDSPWMTASATERYMSTGYSLMWNPTFRGSALRPPVMTTLIFSKTWRTFGTTW